MLPALGGADARPAPQRLQRLGHAAVAPHAANHPLLCHLARRDQPVARRRRHAPGERGRGGEVLNDVLAAYGGLRGGGKVTNPGVVVLGQDGVMETTGKIVTD